MRDNAIAGDTAKYADILRAIIAYSAIDEGTRVFGDTGINALYDDANNLGKIITAAGAGISQRLVSHADEISKVFVQYAGTLALNKIEIKDHVEALNGVLSLSPTSNLLSIDFSEPLWKSMNNDVLPTMAARDGLLGELYAETGNAAGVQNATSKTWADSSYSAIERVVFAAGETGSYTIPSIPVTGKGTFFIGGEGIDTVTGSDSHEIFFTGAGNDAVYSTDGNDIVLSSAGNDNYQGGSGIDTLDYSGDPGAARANLSYNQIRDGYGGIDSVYDFENIILTRFNDELTVSSLSSGRAFYDGGGGTDRLILEDPIVYDIGRNAYYNASSNSKTEFVNFETILSPALVIAPTLSGAWTAPIDQYSLDYSAATSSITFDLVSANFNGPAGGYSGPRPGSISGAGFNHIIPVIPSEYEGYYYVPSIRAIYGSNYGDTYYTNWFSHAYEFYTGRGNDTVYMQPSAYNNFVIHYSGGNDVYHISDDINTVRIDATISLADITNISSSGSGHTFQATLTVNGFGTLTLDYDGHWPDSVPVYLDSGGQIVFYSGTGAYAVSGSSAVASALNGTWGVDDWSGRAGYGQTYYAKAGDDIAHGNDGNDKIYGGEGKDKLYGDGGDDTIYGDFGDDILEGGTGNDTLYGGEDNDVLDGGTGNNIFYGEGSDDTYNIALNSVNTIIDNLGSNKLNLPLLRSEVAASLSGYTLQLYNASRSLVVSIVDYHGITTVMFSDGSGVGIEDVLALVPSPYQGTAGNDSINAASSPAPLNVHLYAGDDFITGSFYSDTIYGDDGNDTLRGGAGSDTLIGDVGRDSLYGGLDDDTYMFAFGDSPLATRDSVNDVTGEGTDTIRITGGISAQNVYAWADLNITGLLHIRYTDNDEILVQGWTQTSPTTLTGAPFSVERIVFDDGTVWDFSAGYTLNDTDEGHNITGSAFADVINGRGGNDYIVSGLGDDTLIGGSGNDTLDGGAGTDTVIYNGPYADYVVTKFSNLVSVRNISGTDGTDSVLNSVEKIEFSDGVYQNGVFTPNRAALQVVEVLPTASGFVARFNNAVDASQVNLYDTQVLGMGTADIVLTGTATGRVNGSVVWDADGKGFTFVKTGGVLATDTYSLWMGSGMQALHDSAGPLDGNADGVVGGDFTKSFTVSHAGAVLSIGDFVRGGGQPVNVVPSAGIPIFLSGGAGATHASFVLDYDPTKLTVSGATLGAGAPTGSTVTMNVLSPGKVSVDMNLGSSLSAPTAVELVNLQAFVPATVTYGAAQVMSLSDVFVNGQRGVGDSAVHVAAYFGDTTGNGAYSALDGQRVLRVAAGLDSGFALYPLIDPMIIGDITGNGQISALDGTRVLQFVAGIPTPQIPPLPVAPSAPAASDVPLLTTGTIAQSQDTTPVTNSLTLDVALSEELSKKTGKEWLFYTT